MKIRQILENKPENSANFDDHKFDTPEEELKWIEHRYSYLRSLNTQLLNLKSKLTKDGVVSFSTPPVGSPLTREVNGINHSYMFVANTPAGTRVAKRIIRMEDALEKIEPEIKKLKAAKTRAGKELASKNFKKSNAISTFSGDVPKTIKLDEKGHSHINNPYYHFGDGTDVERFAGHPESFDWSQHKAYIVEYQRINDALKRTGAGEFDTMFAATHNGETHFAVVSNKDSRVVVFENDVQYPTGLLHFKAVRLMKASQFIKNSNMLQNETIKRYLSWPPR